MSGPVQKLEVSVRCAHLHSPLERHVRFWIHHDSMKRVNPGPSLAAGVVRWAAARATLNRPGFGLWGSLRSSGFSGLPKSPARVLAVCDVWTTVDPLQRRSFGFWSFGEV